MRSRNLLGLMVATATLAALAQATPPAGVTPPTKRGRPTKSEKKAAKRARANRVRGGGNG